MRILPVILSLMLCSACTNQGGVGAEYLGAKYVSDPLGEGVGYDPDPLIRTDAFDCTTYVETALSQCDITRLNKIRYAGGKPCFEKRNHFIESDWITNNANIVENVSRKYGKTKIRDIIINKQKWFKTVHNMTVAAPVKHIKLEYLPYSELTDINNVTDLVVLFIVGKSEKHDTMGTDLAVVHMGFLLSGGKTLRHASSEYGYVMDVDFKTYIAKRMKNKRNIGVVLLEIKNNDK